MRGSRSGRSHRSRVHMVMMMVMVMVVMVMVMMMHWHRFGGLWRRPSRGAGDCGLRKGVSREAE